MNKATQFDTNNYDFNPNSKIGIYLIHGFSSTTYELTQIAKQFADQQYHVVLNNLPGHGTTLKDCNKTKYQNWLDYSKRELGGGVSLTLIHEIHLALELAGLPTKVFGMFTPSEKLELDVDVQSDLMIKHIYNSLKSFLTKF